MEKNNGGKIIAVIALVVAIAGLSLGFAAFSTSLRIDTAANVNTGNANWNVGFSTDGTDIEDVSTARTVDANGGVNPGVIDVTKYTIAQHTNATLSTTTGSSVSYNLSILNKGTIGAVLEAVNFSNATVTCQNAGGSSSRLIEGQVGAGTTSTGGNTTTISNADCAKMFGATVSINGTTYTSATSAITPLTIAANNGVPVVLTLSYLDTADARAVASTLDGDIIVNVGPITVSFTSAS